MMLGIVAGTVAGSSLLISANTGWTTTGLGAALAIYAGFSLLARPLSVPVRMERWLSPVVGLRTGMITGCTGDWIGQGRCAPSRERRYFWTRNCARSDGYVVRAVDPPTHQRRNFSALVPDLPCPSWSRTYLSAISLMQAVAPACVKMTLSGDIHSQGTNHDRSKVQGLHGARPFLRHSPAGPGRSCRWRSLFRYHCRQRGLRVSIYFPWMASEA